MEATCWDRDAKNVAACGSKVKGIFLVDNPARASCDQCRALAGISADLRNPDRVIQRAPVEAPAQPEASTGMMRRHGACVCATCKPFVMHDLGKVLRMIPPQERYGVLMEAMTQQEQRDKDPA